MSLLKRLIGKGLIGTCTSLPILQEPLSRYGMRTDMSWFGCESVPVRARNDRYVKITNVSQCYLGFKLFWLGMKYYEPETVVLLDELLQDETTFFDIGANIGFFTLHVAANHTNVPVVAFEPNPKLFSLLSENVAANGFASVTCEALAISSERGTAQLHLSASDMSASLESDFSHLRNEDTVEVPMESIDAYIREKGIRTPLVIKIDVEGHEIQAFKGAIETFRSIRPDIIIEVAERFETEPYPMLKDLGYRYFRITDEGLTHADVLCPAVRDHFWFSNYLFSPREDAEIQRMSEAVRNRMARVNLHRTSCQVDAAKIDRLNRVR